MMDLSRYNHDLLLAFARGKLPQHAALPPQQLADAAKAAGLSVHRFKRKDPPPRVARVLSILTGLQPSSLLDIGPGRGAFLWPFLNAFPHVPVAALDRLPARVEDIRAAHDGGIERLTGLEGSVCALPFGDGAFDVVSILEVLEHLPDGDPPAAAAEVLRVARRFVVASVPSHPDDNPEHLRVFSPKSLTALFRQAGAERVQIQHVRDHMIAVIR